VETDTLLSRREAMLRSAATTCMAGIALVQAIELPSLFAQGRQFGVMSIAVMALCIVLGWALAAAPAQAPQLWHVVAAAGALTLAGWAVSHAASVPGLIGARGEWASMPGTACAALAAGSLALSLVAAPLTRAAVRTLAVGTGVLVAFAPAVAIALSGLGPGLAGGENVLAAGGHVHSHGSPESAIVFQPLPGGGGHYVFKAIAVPHPTVYGVALLTLAALVFIYGAVAYLRGRTVPAAQPSLASGIEGSLA
jgi:hypothetical protein